jgi:hypothetical protein
MIKSPVQTAPFIEHPVVDVLKKSPNEFDVIALANMSADFMSDGNFSMNQYCTCLLNKLLSLTKSKIKPFIQYQCEKVADPFVWMNKLEKLIDLNRDIFTTKDHKIKIEKTLAVIETERGLLEIKKMIAPTVKFDFDKLKLKLEAYETTEEKLGCLLEAKTDYLLNKPKLIDPTEMPFDQKCDLQINLLKDKRKLEKKTRVRTLNSGAGGRRKLALSNAEGSPQSAVNVSKLQINSKLNLVVDVFYQLMYEKHVNGRPIISGSPNEVAEVIAMMFKDKDGHDISPETVKTILKPSRVEKRPKDSVRLNLL